jgi:hypothetical protein
LGEQQLMPVLEHNCTEDCRENYIGGHTEWINTVISTSADQIAIAPGSLLGEWQAKGAAISSTNLTIPRWVSAPS